MAHETLSLLLALGTLGLTCLCLAMGPMARRLRQSRHLLPVPDPYPPSAFPDRIHQWFGILYVAIFFIISALPVPSADREPAPGTVPELIEAVAPELETDTVAPSPFAEPSPASEDLSDTGLPRGGSSGSAPADSATAEAPLFLEDTLMSLLLYSPLIILFCCTPNARSSPAPLGRQILRILHYLLLAYIFSYLYNLTGLPDLLMEWTQAPELQQISQDVQSIRTPLALAGAILSIVIATPICEEICFRGFIFNSLVRDWGMPLAATVSGLLFGAVHFSLLHFIPLSILGIILAVSYYRSRSIWTPIAIHALFNAIGISALITTA